MRNTAVTIALIFLVLGVLLTPALDVRPAIAQSACDWIEYAGNPLFGQHLGGPKAYYVKVIYDPDRFSGHGDSAYYKMWFGSSAGTGYAYSDDGISWTPGANPVPGLIGKANHPLVKYDPDGFGHGVYYKMWYWDENANIYTIETMRYAESTDGINWTNDQALTQDSIYKLVTGIWPDWNRGSYGPCDLIYNPGGSPALDDSNLWNNRYVMYYDGTNGGNEYIGLAYSADGKHWKRWGSGPVLTPCDEGCGSPAACWDYCSVSYCRVIKIANLWHMWYCGGPQSNHGIGYATSTDGISWTKHPDNPIFHRNDGVGWRNDRTYTPWVLYDPDNFSGHGDPCPFKMWFSGKDAAGRYSIGYATATPVDAGPDQRACEGGSPVPLVGAVPPGGTWSGSGVSGSVFDPTGLAPGDYTVTYTYTNAKGCTSSDNKTVTIDPKPTVTVLSNSPVCIGDTIQLVGISDNATSFHWTGPGGFTSNQQSPTIPNATPEMAGDYTLTVTSPYGCTGTATVAVSVIPCFVVPAGGESAIPETACPVSLSADAEGRVATASMTAAGTLCASCVATDPSGRFNLEMEEGTRLLLANGTPPRLITIRAVKTPAPPTPKNTVLLGQVYELNAYATPYQSTPLSLTISPPARLLLTYNPGELPQNATEVFTATYSPQEGWVPLPPVPGAVAAAGEARGLISHFSLFAALARVPEPAPAKFTVSNLRISPQEVQPGQRLQISIDIANIGERSGDYTVEVMVDGRTRATEKLSLSAGKMQTVEFTLEEDIPGIHRVEVAGLDAEFKVTRYSRLPAIYPWLIIAVIVAIGLVIAKLLLGR